MNERESQMHWAGPIDRLGLEWGPPPEDEEAFPEPELYDADELYDDDIYTPYEAWLSAKLDAERAEEEAREQYIDAARDAASAEGTP